jgi:hypothetical protein
MNIILKETIPQNGVLILQYPEDKNEGHFFGAANHTLAINGVFFRSPRDFVVIIQPDKMLFIWHGKVPLSAGILLNLQLEIPGGDFYYDQKIGVTVQNMVHSPMFMVNLASPLAADLQYWVKSGAASDAKALPLNQDHVQTARNVTIHSESDNSHCIFVIAGEDMYHRPVVEHITGPNGAICEGKKAFARLTRITVTAPTTGEVSIGTGNKFGLPVFLPSPGYLMREVINGKAVSGGTIASGDLTIPSATTGDRRGTYTPPEGMEANGKNSIHLLLSLLAPGNIGIPDFAG